ncbi:MAG: clostripain-related cysteine peptidase [Candidatus Thermoplasmatota archaeon]
MRYGAVAAVAMMAILMTPASSSAGDADAKWTFMVYLDADNNLETYGLLNLGWLEEVGSNGEVNFVVLIDTYGEDADLLYVEQGDSISVGASYGYPKEVNMADPTILEEFIEICCDEYPAEKYALVLWDHGGGWRGLCWDDTTLDETGVDDCITMAELRDAVAGAGEVMDVVGFDLCLMAMPEVAYQVRDYADYVVFSEETVPGQGYPYNDIARALVDDAEMDGRDLSTVIVEEYAGFYAELNVKDVTISAFDMEYMDDVKAAVDYLGTELLDGLFTYMNNIQRDAILAQEYYYPYNIDLKGFADNLFGDAVIDDEGIKEAAAMMSRAIDDGIFACINGDHNYKSSGMAIYLPTTNEGMHHLKDDYIDVPFATETSWYDFVEAFSHFYGRTWGLDEPVKVA